MNLEDKSIVSSEAVNVSIKTIGNIEKEPEGYEIVISGTGSREGIYIPKKNGGQNFVNQLKKGDKLIVVMRGNSFKAIYGPVDKSKLFTYDR